MIPYYDIVSNAWRIRGHEDHEFSSEADARAAIHMAFDFSQQLLSQESRYRRAAQRGQAKQAELS